MIGEVGYAPIGVPQLDAHHRHLADRLTTLARAADRGFEEPAGEGDAILAELAEHCAREEQMMELFAYRDRDRHVRAHAELLESARADLESGRCGWARRLLRALARHQFTEDLLFGIALTAAQVQERRTGT